MNKTKIKNFAVWAREKLITDITYKAGMLGITDSGIAEELPQSTADLKFFDVGTKEYAEVSGNAIKQRDALIKAIREKEKDCGKYKEAFEFVVEEVAYTWFNRLVAIRFMEVNDYLPSGIRVLSSENKAKVEPDFVTTPFDTDLEFTPFEQDHIIELKDKNKLDELFRMLFIKQCNKLHEILPKLFEKTDDYTELLLTISFTDKDGIVYCLTHDVDEDDFNVEKEGQIEIIGWMYQYYNSVPKDIVFENLKKNKKIRKEDIPAATQLFTPDWIVRYMVENSLGRLWVEGHPNKELKSNWKYYMEEAQQKEAVEKQLEEIRKEYSTISPEEIKLIDPCMGSGHILVYAFDVLIQIYDSMGYTARDAVRNIVENNIYGLDIDKRAAQLSYFAMMMKARQYDRRFLGRNIQPNVYAIRESNGLDQYAIDYFCNGDSKLIKDINSITDEMHNAKEYGSIIDVTPVDFNALYARFDEVENDISMSREVVLNELLPLVQVAKAMSQKYDAVITNPPYMGSAGMDIRLSNYIKQNYPNSKSDFFAVFLEKCISLGNQFSKISLVTPQSWMFLVAFNQLRESLFAKCTILSLLHLGTGAFDSGFGTATYVLNKGSINNYQGVFHDLRTGKDSSEKKKMLQESTFKYLNTIDKFLKLPNFVLAYWCPDEIVNLFIEQLQIKDKYSLDCGIKNGKNDTFLRLWHEVSFAKINIEKDRIKALSNMESGEKKWFKCNKGGGFRKWYGNYEYVLNLEHDARDIKSTVPASTYRLRKKENYFQNAITWPLVSGNKFGCRFMESDTLPDVNANIIIFNNQDYNLIAYMNSKVFDYILDMLNPSLAFPIDTIAQAPYIPIKSPEIERLVSENIAISKEDWSSFEQNWDFVSCPLVLIAFKQHLSLISKAYENWAKTTDDRYYKLKSNEEQINTMIICENGLQNIITPDVSSEYITINRSNKTEDIKSLISYAVGCMLGRYSLDVDGLAYAGGEWDDSKYMTFIPDADNCIPLTDEEYFEDDIVGRFVKFIEVVYGKDTLEENLNFIADALGNKGKTSREVIRNYFLTDFIKDHIKKYQKRPIYWLFDSGKQNGFKALVYMHRWNEDTVGHLRVEYLHKMQRVYEKEMERMQEIIDNSKDNKEISAADKRKEKLQKQLKETKDYDAKIAHIALSRIDIDLDDGVKVNYDKVQTVDGKNMQILAKI